MCSMSFLVHLSTESVAALTEYVEEHEQTRMQKVTLLVH